MSGTPQRRSAEAKKPRRDEFTTFARDAEVRLRHALVAAYGPQTGRDAAEDALVYAWEHWEKVRSLDNPVGYLYRIGFRRASRRPRSQPVLSAVDAPGPPLVEPGLDAALETLSVMQRTSVVLVEGFEWRQAEVARLLGLRPSTVQKHLERGLRKLRDALGVSGDV